MPISHDITPFRSHSPFGGAEDGLGRYTINGLVFDLVADFGRDVYYFNPCQPYGFNGLTLDLIADFNKDFYAEA